MKTRFVLSKFIAAILVLAFAATASAQNTSASARGTIADANGAPIANASVTITHVPSSSTKAATTSDTGNFFQSGLRVGGPYTIAVSADGYRGTEIEDIYFSQGTQAPLDLALESAAESIEEIVVSSQPAPTRDLNNGVGSAFSTEDIVNTTGGARDVIRTLLRDPLAQSSGEGHLSVAGVNGRFNGLAIDGSLQQDDFGLSSNTYATDRSPINLDAVESASLVASDYDVTTSGFTGGLVNLTTKSGTNEWGGSAFYYWQDDGMYGSEFDGGSGFDPGPIDETEYGVTIGGPIIKNKLFFFVSYDEFESASSVNFENNDAANGVEPGLFDALSSIIQSSLGYDPGGRPDTATTPETSERALVKLDWNISDLHRAAFTYQSTEETGINVDSQSFQTAWYAAPIDLTSYTFQLFSDWNDRLSTTLRINNKEFERGQICNAGPGVGHIEVVLTQAEVAGTALDGLLTGDPNDPFIGGCDRFRHANEFNDERLQVFAKADYFVGDHVVSAGLEYEEYDLFNLFASNGARGYFQYGSLADLLTSSATVTYQNDISNDISKAGQSWGYERTTLFVQDSWQVTPTFELGYGIRYESLDQSDKPAFSQTLMDTYGVDSSANLDGLDIVLPRISFRWDLADRTTLTGGFGLFAGGDPKVWTSNAFQLPTVITPATFFATTDPTVIPQPLIDIVTAGTPVPIDVISPNFEIPSDWKASLRLEQAFDIGSSEDYVFTALLLHTRTNDGFKWTNLAQTALSTGVAPDGRPIYADLQDLGLTNLTELGNFSDGESNVIALGLGKRYDNGLDFTFSYAYQDVEVVTEGTSSRGISNWRSVFTTDRNNPSPHVSPDQVEHSFKLNLGFEKDFFGSGQSMTRIDAFARRFSGEPVPFTFDIAFPGSNPLFGRAGSGESPFDEDMLYVPTGPSDPLVVYASGFDRAGFEEYVGKNVSGTGILKISDTTRWTTLMDLRIQQEIPGLKFLGNSLGDNNFRVVLDIENFLNFINSDWGRATDNPRFVAADIVRSDLVLASDVAANGVDLATALTGDMPRLNCLSASDCVYRFTRFNDRTTNFTSQSRSVYKIRLGVRFDF